ncbi:uncharacterized protein LOC125538538 [Triticum urartu]|uniref:uncharacterized protein LOC125538538 n=1 Tax=Triticum urartu TaxID=4572 RepID=UPI002043097A|nr:uncharacterized protein LOC125538538 [Triticum urartu]
MPSPNPSKLFWWAQNSGPSPAHGQAHRPRPWILGPTGPGRRWPGGLLFGIERSSYRFADAPGERRTLAGVAQCFRRRRSLDLGMNPQQEDPRENPEKLKLTKVLTEAVKCAQALKTDELIADTRVKEAFAELVNEVYPRLPESLQDQLLVDFKLNILRRAQEKNTPPAELMDGEQKKNFLRKKGARTNTLWIIEKLVLLVGVCCFMYLMSFYVTGY